MMSENLPARGYSLYGYHRFPEQADESMDVLLSVLRTRADAKHPEGESEEFDRHAGWKRGDRYFSGEVAVGYLGKFKPQSTFPLPATFRYADLRSLSDPAAQKEEHSYTLQILERICQERPEDLLKAERICRSSKDLNFILFQNGAPIQRARKLSQLPPFIQQTFRRFLQEKTRSCLPQSPHRNLGARVNVECILEDLRKAAPRDLRQIRPSPVSPQGYRICHDAAALTGVEAGIFHYLLNPLDYDRAILRLHRPTLWANRKRLGHPDNLDQPGVLELRQLSSIGNADEEAKYTPLVSKTFWVRHFKGWEESEFGNYYVSLSSVNSPEQCPAWSPARPVKILDTAFNRLLRELGEGVEELDRRSMRFPKQLGEGDAPAVVRIVMGPYESHRPDESKPMPNQCEWGGEQWQSVEYRPGLPLANLKREPILQQGAFLCLRVGEADWPKKHQPLLQQPVSKALLEQKGELTFGVDPRNPRHVLQGEGAEGRKLVSRSPLTLTLGIK